MALLLALLAPPAGRAAPLYTVTMLPAGFSPADINNAGQMAGVADTGLTGMHAALYSDGIVTDLGVPGTTWSFASAINEAGALAGNFDTPDGVGHAFLYQDRTLRDIGAAYALGINASGAVVGQQDGVAGASGFLYRDGVLTRIGQLAAGNVSLAAAINDDGQIVGESNLAFAAQEPTHPYRYDGGTLHDLGTLAGRGVNSAVAINNAGQVAGYSTAPDGHTHAFIYEHGVMTDLGGFGGIDVTIGGMKQHGDIVGTGNTPDGPDVAFISSQGALVDLDTLLEPGSGWHIASAADINDSGQIIATGCRNDRCSAVRLDLAGTVPEPRAAGLAASGLLVLLALQRRAHPPARTATSSGRAGRSCHCGGDHAVA